VQPGFVLELRRDLSTNLLFFPMEVCPKFLLGTKREGRGLAMRSLQGFFSRLGNVAARREYRQRLNEEIEEHIALQTADNIRAGLSRTKRGAAQS
jgi:hypothetical protein